MTLIATMHGECSSQYPCTCYLCPSLSLNTHISFVFASFAKNSLVLVNPKETNTNTNANANANANTSNPCVMYKINL